MSDANKGVYGPIKQDVEVPFPRPRGGPYEQKITKTINVPIPLKDKGTVTIGNLPVDLTKEEADRIYGVIMALACCGDTE